MTPLHTAFSFTIVPNNNGVIITLKEKLTVCVHPDPAVRKLNTFAILVSDEVVENPREVVFNQASSNSVESVCNFMNSLTDELIYHQWFKVKVHKNKKTSSE